jgi:dTDP-4-amino-4,6-dideoxygalactose transaminase
VFFSFNGNKIITTGGAGCCFAQILVALSYALPREQAQDDAVFFIPTSWATTIG